jgi:hypothetical protein
MAKYQTIEDALASLHAVDWESLPPPARRELFAGLTSIILEMMKADITPMGKRRTNVDRDRRSGENEDKVALIYAACAALHFEAMDDEQLRRLFSVLHGSAGVVQEILQARMSLQLGESE